MSTAPLDEIQWKSPEWIQQFGLHTGNVLDYFSESPFYDRTSNNQVLRMQFQFQPIPPNVTNIQKFFQSRLSEMVGPEFVVAHVREPDFWVIRRQKRLSPTTALPEQDFYIIGANIYQSPKVYDILSSRLLSGALSIKNSVDLLNKMSNFNIADGGHQYPSFDENGSQNKSAPMQTASSLTTSNTNANNTPMAKNTATPTTVYAMATSDNGGANLASNAHANSNSDILASAFDNLLNSVITSSKENSIYLDDIPLYGKGSTVEQLGLKINLEDDGDIA